MHRFAGSETESETAALDKEFWVKRASEVCPCVLCVLVCALIWIAFATLPPHTCMHFSHSLALTHLLVSLSLRLSYYLSYA